MHGHTGLSYQAVLSCKLFIVADCESVDVEETSSVTIQMKAFEQFFSVVPFIMLYKVVLAFESVDKML